MAKIILDFEDDNEAVKFKQFVESDNTYKIRSIEHRLGDDTWRSLFSQSVLIKLETYENFKKQALSHTIKNWVNDCESSASMQAKLGVGESTISKLIDHFKLTEQYEANKKINKNNRHKRFVCKDQKGQTNANI